MGSVGTHTCLYMNFNQVLRVLNFADLETQLRLDGWLVVNVFCAHLESKTK